MFIPAPRHCRAYLLNATDVGGHHHLPSEASRIATGQPTDYTRRGQQSYGRGKGDQHPISAQLILWVSWSEKRACPARRAHFPAGRHRQGDSPHWQRRLRQRFCRFSHGVLRQRPSLGEQCGQVPWWKAQQAALGVWEPPCRGQECAAWRMGCYSRSLTKPTSKSLDQHLELAW